MTKQVQLSDEAYRRLKLAKRPGDSFSDVVCRYFLTGSLADLAMLGRSDADMEAHKRMLDDMDRLDLTRSERLDEARRGGPE